jgi:hypothetical protein
MLRLGPMLVSGKSSEVRFAIVLLNGLTRNNAVDEQIATQISDLFSETVIAGTAPGATPTERRTADAIIALAEQKPVLPTSEDTPAQTASVITGTALANLASKPLPVRVYIHIADEVDRPRAEEARAAFHGQSMLVPGIERTGPKSSPSGNAQVRYCASKVDAPEIDRVRDLASGTLPVPPQMVALPEKLCGRVRHNHFELWFPTPSE